MRPTQTLPIVLGLALAYSVMLAAQAPSEHQHEAGAHRHPEAAKLKNPVPADATSIAAGQKLYDKNCSPCHGATGKGDGKMAAQLNPKPPDLTDSEWKHGSSDGEIFTLIRDGSKGTGMKAFGSKITAHEIWDVVNYIRSIGPKPSH
jgi:mono/diheme cytochrome c family protein